MRRRFWTTATVVDRDDGFGIALDGRVLKTPGKADIAVPTHVLAQAIADEWSAVDGDVDPNLMPMTRSANSAIDKVAPQHAEVAGMLAAYAETDLLCHRADGPAELAARQTEAWDPWLNWAQEAFDAPLTAAIGVMHVAQPEESLRNYRAAVLSHDPFHLTGLLDLVTLSGSLVLGLAVAKGRLGWKDAWEASCLEESWQQEFWGVDQEAAARNAARRDAFQHADTWLKLLQEHKK